MRWLARVGGAVVVATLAGCAGGPALNGGGVGEIDGMPASANVLVLRPAQLEQQQGGSVLDAMRENLPGISIAGNADAGGCPAVGIRGPDTAPGLTDPKVYVDGTATSGTCVLESLAAEDVSRVEVYPLGFTTRPGYATNANGLILIFTKRATDGEQPAGQS